MKALRKLCLDKANQISSETIAEINRQEIEVYTTRKARQRKIGTDFSNFQDELGIATGRARLELQQKLDAIYVARAQVTEGSPEDIELLEQERELRRMATATKADAALRRIEARKAMARAYEEADAACSAGVDDCRKRMAAAKAALRITRETIKSATAEELREIYRNFFGEDCAEEQPQAEPQTEEAQA